MSHGKTTEWISLLLLNVFITLCTGEQVCTYKLEKGTEGNQHDWRGYKTVANTQRCKEFCTSVPECTAAEYSYDTDACYLYRGPTTLRYNKAHVFMTKKSCKEVTTVEETTSFITTSTSTTEDTTTPTTTRSKSTTEQTFTTTPPTSTVITTTASPTMSTTSSTTLSSSTSTLSPSTTTSSPNSTTTTTIKTTAVTTTPLPSTFPMTAMIAELDMLSPAEGEMPVSPSHENMTTMTSKEHIHTSTIDETRTKRSASTQAITKVEIVSKRLTTEKTRIPSRKRKKPRMPAAIMDMLHGASYTDSAQSVTDFTTIQTSSTTPPSTTHVVTKTRKHSKPEKLLTSMTSKFGFNTPHLETSLTKSPAIRFTTPLPKFKPSHFKETTPVESSRTVQLTLKNGLTLNGNPPRKTKTKVLNISMSTKIYRQPSSPGTVRSRYLNRVDVPTADPAQPGSSSIRSWCGYGPCFPVYRHQAGYRVFVPIMKIYPPFFRPQYQSQQPQTGYNPIRFRGFMKIRFPTYVRAPYQYQYPVHPPPVYSRNPYHPYRPAPFPPQHAVVAHYGRQNNPFANNFKRASLKSPKTHQVAVIPGGRYQPGSGRRGVHKQPHGYRPRDRTTARTPYTKSKQEITQVNDQARQQRQEPRAITSDTRRRQGRHAETSTSDKDQKWQLKSHYNTYTLRLGISQPITGYKRCYQRQQLPQPPKILVVAFKPDGSFSAKSLPVTYPRRACAFINPRETFPEMYLPSPLVIFTGTSFVKDVKDLQKIFAATAPKARYDLKSLQQKSTTYRYTSLYNPQPVFRQLKIPISIARAMVSFDKSRMGFIYRLTVRLPRVLRSRNLLVPDSIPADTPFMKITPQPFVRGS